RGEHENRDALAGLAQFAANRETIAAGNHYVENNQVVAVDIRLIQGFFACGNNIDGVGLFAQTFGDKARDSGIVFNEQKPEETIIRQVAGKVRNWRTGL